MVEVSQFPLVSATRRELDNSSASMQATKTNPAETRRTAGNLEHAIFSWSKQSSLNPL